jgi:hypothetical protein
VKKCENGQKYGDIEEVMDLCHERMATQMVGKEYRELLAEMGKKGYRAGKVVNHREAGTGTVLLTNGSHETRMQYRVIFNWKEKYPGMSEPDKVIACQWVKPLRPEPFEVR